MRNPRTSLFPLHAVILAFACLGVPDRAAAQGCVECGNADEDLSQPRCQPKLEGPGYESCTIEKGTEKCQMSSDEPDCGLVLALDGRGLRDLSDSVGPRGDAGTTDPADALAGTLTRHECSGAIIKRSYAPQRVAERRDGLRHVTI